jgi:hypothetical protein
MMLAGAPAAQNRRYQYVKIGYRISTIRSMTRRINV